MIARPRRSVLYMPGLERQSARQGRDPARRRADPRPRGFGRPRRQGRRAGPGRRRRARAISADARSSSGSTVSTRHGGRNDLIAAAGAGPDAILLPKVDGPGAIMHAARVLRENGAPDRTRLWAMMETPNAILGAGASRGGRRRLRLPPGCAGDGPQRPRQGDARPPHPGAADHDRPARQSPCRRARPWRRHHRRRL